MLFALRRGRPRSKVTQDHELNKQNLIKSASADVLQTLVLLKKINDEQNESAKFYQRLRGQYHNSIDSPGMRSSCVLEIGNMNARSKQHPSTRDEMLFKAWNEIKVELNKVDRCCEEIIYKVLVENKMKYELLNPTNFTRNSLRILQAGLDRITRYRSTLSHRLF